MANNALMQNYWRERLETKVRLGHTRPRQHHLPQRPVPQPSLHQQQRRQERLQRQRLRNQARRPPLPLQAPQQQARPIQVAPANGPPAQQQPQPSASHPQQPGNALQAPAAHLLPPNHPAASARPSHQVPAPPRHGRFSVTEWTTFLWDCVVDAFILVGQVAIVLWLVYNLRRLHSNLFPDLYQPSPLSVSTNAGSSLNFNNSTVFESVPSSANSSASNHSNADAVDPQNEPVVSVNNDTCVVPLLDLDTVDESAEPFSSTSVKGTTIATATHNGGTASSTMVKDDNPSVVSSHTTRFLFLDNATCPAVEPPAFDALEGLDEQPVTAIESLDGYVAPVGSNSSSTRGNSSDIAYGLGTDVDTMSDLAIGHDDATVLYDEFSSEDATTIDIDLGASINIAVPTPDMGVFPSEGSESTDDKLQSQIAAIKTTPPASDSSLPSAEDSPAAAQPTDTISGIYDRTLAERVVASVRDISDGIVPTWLVWITTIFIAFVLGRRSADPVVQQRLKDQN